MKALNMVLGAVGLALRGKVIRPHASVKGPWPQTMTYTLDGVYICCGCVATARRPAARMHPDACACALPDASENAHARGRLEACALPLYGHLVSE